MICAHSELVWKELFFKSDGIGISFKLIQDGFLYSKIIAKISLGLRNRLNTDNHAIIGQFFLALIEKQQYKLE